jgi:hypothetical protein
MTCDCRQEGPARFGTGERIVFESYTREMFDKTQRWMRGWDRFGPDQLADAKYEVAVLAKRTAEMGRAGPMRARPLGRLRSI